MRRSARLLLAATAAALVLAGACTSGVTGPDGGPASPLVDCAGLSAPPGGAGPQAGAALRIGSAPSAGAAAGARTGQADPLPELTLPCFTGEEPFALADLRGPAVVNLWATWCEPCIEELPVLQRLAARAADQVHVLGVVTVDTRTRAAALATDLGLTFPALYDRDERLLAAMARAGLPVTFFVDAQGRITHVYQGAPFDDQRLAELVEQHLQVAVGSG